MTEAYLGLFASAFIAATLLPAYSEILLATLVHNGHEPLALWAWATAGNTLGSVLNWLLGRYLLHFSDRKWFPFKEKNIALAQRWFQRYGRWTLLLSWLPLGGDALTFIAGMMKIPFWQFLGLTAIGKGTRYAMVLGLAGMF
ncbi:DedA family protein [Parahaliea sp. F7430]|uniref:DedA family protein n=1 Tax=Sediminihaliea albiluteola TaxID=2758564 RepID=A0A7W2TWJ6_9GAMM|nr:YqaA family protein [Sediminihaliea albiluteola]MBA6413144.1 DedA family protein [Sediminihaliea albiluteola]